MEKRILGRGGLGNVGSTHVQLLAQDLNEIEAAVSKIEVQGHRYAEQSQKMIGK